MSSTFVLPDLRSEWPFGPTLNPHHEAASAASSDWVESWKTLDGKAQAAFNRCKFGLLTSLAWSRVEAAHLRLACDLINWFFVFDEWSDIKDGPAARELATTLIDILKDPSRVSFEQSSLGQMTTCFWSRVLEFSSPSSAHRLLDSLCSYIEAVFREAEDRERGIVRNIDEYLALRRETVGARPCFDFFLLPVDISQDIMTRPKIERLTRGGVDLIILLNDIYSYNFERSHGLDGHNIVAAVMKEKQVDVQDAMNYVGELFHEVAQNFLQDVRDIPSYSPAIDQILSHYISGIVDWITALIEWSFESERYFGVMGPEIKLTRTVELRSKRGRCS